MKRGGVNSYTQGQSLIKIIVILVVVGLITVLYYYLQKQVPEVAGNTEKSSEEVVKPEEKVTQPQISLSSYRLEQGDTLLIKIESKEVIDKPTGKFGLNKIDFLKSVTGQWVAIVGIDVKKEPGEYELNIDLPNGEQFKKEIEIIEKKFPITELLVTEELREKDYTPSKIVENITTKENLILKEILNIYTPKAYFSTAFINPLENIKVVGAFGNIRKSEEVGAQHLGVDLDAPVGTLVYAVNNGVVRFSENLNVYGKTLIIDHGLGIFSLYLHLNKFNVLSGEKVWQGDIIGETGNTGYSIAPHLHFAVKIRGASVDPLRFIKTILFQF